MSRMRSFIRAILITGSRIEGKIDLTGARTDSLIELDESGNELANFWRTVCIPIAI